jgi:hypothetical protein
LAIIQAYLHAGYSAATGDGSINSTVTCTHTHVFKALEDISLNPWPQMYCWLVHGMTCRRLLIQLNPGVACKLLAWHVIELPSSSPTQLQQPCLVLQLPPHTQSFSIKFTVIHKEQGILHG